MNLTCEVTLPFLSFRIRSLNLIRAVGFGKSTESCKRSWFSKVDPGPPDPRGSPSMHVALAFLSVRWEAWGLSRWLRLVPHGVQTAHAVLGAGFARALSNRVLKSSQGAAHLPASGCARACAYAHACGAPTASTVWWGTKGKACSYAGVSTRPESNPDITDVSEMGVRSPLIV